MPVKAATTAAATGAVGAPASVGARAVTPAEAATQITKAPTVSGHTCASRRFSIEPHLAVHVVCSDRYIRYIPQKEKSRVPS
ncbi:hypothetical protein GCM10010214_17200 [Streptomyces abikoensis]|nr:hypothetical protein GCM10010214_17200 [Streptomyces abikoensis]